MPVTKSKTKLYNITIALHAHDSATKGPLMISTKGSRVVSNSDYVFVQDAEGHHEYQIPTGNVLYIKQTPA